MKNILGFLLLLSLNFPAQGQGVPETKKDTPPVPGSSLDSLRSERNIFSTALYQGDTRLRPSAVKALYKDDALARRQFISGQILQPIAPLVALSGIALGYVGLKGEKGVYTALYEREWISADYTIRNRTQVGVGVGLFVAGIALIEFSNDLVAKSARGYNSRHEGQLSSDGRPTLHIGVTPSGNLGLFARF